MVGKQTNVRPERVAKQRAKLQTIRGRMVARRDKVERPVPEWDWTYGKERGAVAAWTRSEAKALIKDVLGVKGRLPKEVQVVARTQQG